jgi:hypothetical protein
MVMTPAIGIDDGSFWIVAPDHRTENMLAVLLVQVDRGNLGTEDVGDILDIVDRGITRLVPLVVHVKMKFRHGGADRIELLPARQYPVVRVSVVCS